MDTDANANADGDGNAGPDSEEGADGRSNDDSPFGTSGIRGRVGETVTAALALEVGRAVGVEAREFPGGDAGRSRVVVGRDPREHGPTLADALAAGVREAGADVLDLGQAATPTVARAVGWLDADVGVAVTASHNPPSDNGLKLWTASGRAFDADRRERVTRRIRSGVDPVAPEAYGRRRDAEARRRHARATAAAVEIDADDPPRVAVDVGNGAGGVTVDALAGLGCPVETLNAQPDGTFPARPSEPEASTLGSLCALVGGSDAVLGIAHDGDADRVLAVDETGRFVPKDGLLAVLAGASAGPGDRVAVPVDTSLAVADYLAERDVGLERTPVGDVHVAEAVAGGCAFGGEPSGAWIWPEVGCPDATLAACRLTALAAERPLSERVGEVPDYPIRRESVETDRKSDVVAAIRERVREEYDDDRVETLDGVRVALEDAWFLIRASGTQPLVRLTAEAREPDRVEAALATARELVSDALE